MHKMKLRDTEHLPMHVHLSAIEMPIKPVIRRKASNVDKVEIRAPIPEFFQQTLEELRLEKRNESAAGGNTDTEKT